MKRVLKLTLGVVALVVCSTSVFAQKMGRINMQELIVAMPETTEMQTNLEAYSKDLSDNLETMQVELNNKFADFQKNYETMTEAVRNVRQKEMQDMQGRIEEFQQSAYQELQKKQNELLQPIITKAQEAVAKVSKAGSYVVVFDTSANSMAYIDESAVADLLASVKRELSIK